MLFKQFQVLGQFRFAMLAQKNLKPGEQLTRKSHKLLNENYQTEQPIRNVDAIKQEYSLTLGERFRYGFTPEEMENQNDMIKVALALNNATPGEILSYRTQQAIKKYQKWALDTGSYAVKAAVLSERVISSMYHMQNNRQDKNGARTMMKLMNLRRITMNLVKRNEYHMYKLLLTDYGMIDRKYPNAKFMDHRHTSSQKTKRYTRIETNIGRM